MAESSKQKLIKGSATKAFAETLTKSIERGNDIATKIKNLKESLTKRDKAITSTKVIQKEDSRIENPIIFPLESKAPKRLTVLESCNNEQVKAIIEELIVGLKPESQQNAFDDSLLYEDKEFKDINLEEDKLEKDFEQLINFEVIKWKRIKEIATNPLQCEFDKPINNNPDRSLIVQGYLGDNWFLSAVSIIFRHDYLWDRLICEGHFEKYREYGLYVFRFYKDNNHYHVIIDDKIPVIEKSTGAYIPLFARCLNSNIFWVSLIEKAYAKLHHRYYALHNGCIENALYDLTGINPETLILNSEAILEGNEDKKKELLDALKILTLSGACIATSINTERIQYPKAKEAELKFNSLGLLVNYWYHFKAIRDITESQSITLPVYNLVQLECPWGLAIERGKLWKGDFNPKSEKWSESLKKRFNEFYPTYTNRYGESLFGNEFSSTSLNGNCILSLEDYLKYFNTLIILRDFPYLYNAIEFEGVWVPSYGHPHVRCVNWMNNPHYIFRIESKNIDLTSVIIVLQQKDPRFIYAEHNTKQLSIGLVVMNMSLVEDDIKFYDPKKIVGFIKPTERRFISWSTKLKSGKYCVIPITRTEGDIGSYVLKIYYSCRNDNIAFYKGEGKMILEKEELGEEGTMRVIDKRLMTEMVKGFLEKSKVVDWAEKVLTPFSLDELLNTEIGPASIREAKNKLYWDNKKDIELRLYDNKLDREKEYSFILNL